MSKTGIYHVMLRGIGKQNIFEDDPKKIIPQKRLQSQFFLRLQSCFSRGTFFTAPFLREKTLFRREADVFHKRRFECGDIGI